MLSKKPPQGQRISTSRVAHSATTNIGGSITIYGNIKMRVNRFNSKVYTEKQLAKLNEEQVEKLFNNYEAKLSGQMVKSLGCSIINMYSMGACPALGITNQDALSEDLENDPCSSKIYL